MNTTPQASRIWLNKLLTHKPDQLGYSDLEAQATLRICCAILAPHDPPSPGGYSPQIVDKYHAAWLSKLPAFSRVAYLETWKSPTTKNSHQRLWLLPDWLESESERLKRAQYYADRSREWLELRVRFWRVRCTLLERGVAKCAIEGILANAWDGYRNKFEEQLPILNLLGFSEEVSASDLLEFERNFQHKLGHVYHSPIDFTQALES